MRLPNTLARLALSVALLVLAPLGAQADTLKESEALFSSGDFDASAQRVNEQLLHESELKNPERAKLYLMKARLESAFGRKHDVRLWLEKAYQSDATLALDPVLDPPPLQLVWNEIKKEGRTGKSAPEAEATAAPASASIAAGLLPLGFGHDLSGRYRDGALFLSSELLVLLAASTLPGTDDPTGKGTQHPLAREIIGTVSFLGLYGYEVGDLLSDVGGVRTLLNFFPLGAAQAKNGDTSKALALAAAQSVLLTASALAPKESQRRTAVALLGSTWVYGVVDGFLYDRPAAAAPKKGAAFAPLYDGHHAGVIAAIMLP